MERDDASPLMGATVDCLEVNQVLNVARVGTANGVRILAAQTVSTISMKNPP